jgi:hypothetical protein
MDRVRQIDAVDLLAVTAAAITKFWQSAAAVTPLRQVLHTRHTSMAFRTIDRGAD